MVKSFSKVKVYKHRGYDIHKVRFWCLALGFIPYFKNHYVLFNKRGHIGLTSRSLSELIDHIDYVVDNDSYELGI